MKRRPNYKRGDHTNKILHDINNTICSAKRVLCAREKSVNQQTNEINKVIWEADEEEKKISSWYCIRYHVIQSNHVIFYCTESEQRTMTIWIKEAVYIYKHAYLCRERERERERRRGGKERFESPNQCDIVKTVYCPLASSFIEGRHLAAIIRNTANRVFSPHDWLIIATVHYLYHI